MKKNYKTILIGNSGFLGRCFLSSDDLMLSVGRTNLSTNYLNDHLHIDDWSDFSPLNNIDFDNVIFLIGSSDHEVINNEVTLAIEKNVLPLMSFLDYLLTRKNKPKKIVAFTTMLQYDSSKLVLPCNEVAVKKPYINKYVFSKYLAEHVSEYYRSHFDIIDVRLSNVYGPTELKRPDIVPSLIWSLLKDSKTFVRTKKPIRDFVYVGDVITAVNGLLNTDFSGPINIGSGFGTKVDKLCKVLENLSKKPIIELNEKHTGHLEYYHDLSLLKSLINFKATPIEKGLEYTFNPMKNFQLYNKKIIINF
jgi:nucleoside-diphosphate-sugar epimerase